MCFCIYVSQVVITCIQSPHQCNTGRWIAKGFTNNDNSYSLQLLSWIHWRIHYSSVGDKSMHT